MDSLLYSRNKKSVENVDWAWRICAEKSEDGSISRSGHGHNFLGLTLSHIDYLQEGKTITGEYYASLLDRFDAILKEKRSHLAKKYYEILPHPPHSPNLAPSDYFLFSNLKIWLGGKRFSSNEEIIAATNEYFEEYDKNYFLECIKKLEYRYNKYIQLKGDYVEK